MATMQLEDRCNEDPGRERWGDGGRAARKKSGPASTTPTLSQRLSYDQPHHEQVHGCMGETNSNLVGRGIVNEDDGGEVDHARNNGLSNRASSSGGGSVVAIDDVFGLYGERFAAFMGSLNQVPQLLSERLAQMRHIDEQCLVEKDKIFRAADILLREIKQSTVVMCDDDERVRESIADQARIYAMADRKVELASECYDYVDSVVRKLDQELEDMETELRNGAFQLPPLGTGAKMHKRSTNVYPRLVKENQPITATVRSITDALLSDDGLVETAPSPRSIKKRRSSSSSSTGPAPSSHITPTNASVADSSEPVYCLCRTIAYGEMVACDNPDCDIEWFHFQCVGLKNTPKGKWYCHACSNTQEKPTKKKRSRRRAF